MYCSIIVCMAMTNQSKSNQSQPITDNHSQSQTITANHSQSQPITDKHSQSQTSTANHRQSDVQGYTLPGINVIKLNRQTLDQTFKNLNTIRDFYCWLLCSRSIYTIYIQSYVSKYDTRITIHVYCSVVRHI